MTKSNGSQIREHFDNIASDYDTFKENHGFYYGALKNLLSEKIDEESNILDVGCGTGTLLDSLKPKMGVGFDISPEMIKIARKKFPLLHFDVKEGENMSYPSLFDWILMNDIIEHLHNPEIAIKNVCNTAGNRAKVLVTTANKRWERLLNIAEKLNMKMPEGPHNWLTIKEIKEIFGRHEFLATDEGYRLPKLRGMGLIHFAIFEEGEYERI